jgi:hypothetical protein
LRCNSRPLVDAAVFLAEAGIAHARLDRRQRDRLGDAGEIEIAGIDLPPQPVDPLHQREHQIGVEPKLIVACRRADDPGLGHRRRPGAP